jgi:hypothetical protein
VDLWIPVKPVKVDHSGAGGDTPGICFGHSACPQEPSAARKKARPKIAVHRIIEIPLVVLCRAASNEQAASPTCSLNIDYHMAQPQPSRGLDRK